MSSFDQEVIIKPTVKENRNSPTSPERRVCPWNPCHYPSASNQQPVSQPASQPASQSASMDRWISEEDSSQLESSKAFSREHKLPLTVFMHPCSEMYENHNIKIYENPQTSPERRACGTTLEPLLLIILSTSSQPASQPAQPSRQIR